MSRSMKWLLVIALTILSTSSWKIRSVNQSALQKKLTVAVLTPLIFCSFHQPVLAGMDAFDAAKNAMLEKKDKNLKERDLSDLPPAAKKRRALTLCKESEYFKRAGYFSSSSCTNDVFEGNYDRILNGKGKSSSTTSTAASPVKSSVSTTTTNSISAASSPVKSSASTTLATKSVSTVAAPVKPSATIVSPTKSSVMAAPPIKSASIPASVTKAIKVVDLSDLPFAAKKRRALGACKNPDIRKTTGMISESKCTESVMNGDINRLIEALEYER